MNNSLVFAYVYSAKYLLFTQNLHLAEMLLFPNGNPSNWFVQNDTATS
jgi:hypothetical protein